MITRSVTVAKIRREYWEQIADGRKQFELRDEKVAATSRAFVFVDASTGEHLATRVSSHAPPSRLRRLAMELAYVLQTR